MTAGPLQVLLVEDSPLDVMLLTDQLADVAGDSVTLRAVPTIADAVAEIERDPPDCVLLDLSLPDASGLEALAELHFHAPDVPIVVLSGADAEELAVRAVAEGAQDYLVKGQAPVPLMLRAVRYAIERKDSERELQAMALTDALTGLPNRARLMDRIGHALERMARTRTAVALLFLDLDRFKLVNDSLGHTAGDRLLLAVADRLRRAVRPSDTVARFGGDEFIVLCEDLASADEAEIVVERIHRALGLPVEIDGTEIVPGASIGVALATGPDDSAERLLQDADAAMYKAKAEGRGHAHFAAEMRAGARARLELEGELHRALRSGEFQLHFQPQVALDRPGRPVVGVEALVRWRHPERGVLGPEAFIPAAEETGLIRRLGTWVLREAIRRLGEWDAAGIGGGRLTMSVNLSAHQLADDDVVAAVRDELARAGVAPERLCLEITESVLLDPRAGARERLAALKALGVRLAMDDFGTGYGSLSSLTAFPIDALKVDRQFVLAMGADDPSRRIVAAVTGLAQGLGLDLIAEGVEDADVADDLAAMGCQRAQGYAFARPLPADELEALLLPASRRAGAVVRVFLCDDAEELRTLLRASLDEDDAITVVGEAGDGEGIVEAVRRAMADVVLMDLSMPRVDGLEAVAALRSWRADLGIIVLSGFEQERMRTQAIALGADRYVEKRASIAEVKEAVHAVAAIRRPPAPLVDIPTSRRPAAA